MNVNPANRRPPRPAAAAPTNLYEALRLAHHTPGWLASQLRLPEPIVLGWCWGLDLPPACVRERVERVLDAHQICAVDPWSPLDLDSLKPGHLTLVTTDTQEEPRMEFISREYLTQQELERFGVPVDTLTGLRPDPFDNPENPEDVFRPPLLRAAEDILWDAVKRKQIVIFTGEPGAGKSTLIRRAYGTARRQKQVRFLSTATLNRKRLTHTSLVTALLRDLTGKDTSNMSQEQRDELLRNTLAEQRGVFPCLLIDEAHHLSNEALLAIKHVWDSHTLFRQLAVVLVGHPSLSHRMATDPVIREFTMRARVVEMPVFDGPTTAAYLEWRFARVGVKAGEIFPGPTCELLGRRGRYPLLINNLAIRAMRAAAPTGRVVEPEHLGRI